MTIERFETGRGSISSAHILYSAKQWGKLASGLPLHLRESQLSHMRGLNEPISLEEVAEVFLPISSLLTLHVRSSQKLYRSVDNFLGKMPAKVPFVIGIAGSVAVGKSTAARVLQSVLSDLPDHPRVDLVTTDGFLYPNDVLRSRSLMGRKGFPESYDRRALLKFLDEVKSGSAIVSAPCYSHLTYDVVPEKSVVIEQPDILIVEGLTVLQTGSTDTDNPAFVSDFFDFSIYIDAAVDDIEKWYIERFLLLRKSAFEDPRSYFNRYSMLGDGEAVKVAKEIWDSINKKNLLENILPTRKRADLVLTKAVDHRVREVRLRRM